MYLIFIKQNKGDEIQIYNHLVNKTLTLYQRANSTQILNFLNKILKYNLYNSLYILDNNFILSNNHYLLYLTTLPSLAMEVRLVSYFRRDFIDEKIILFFSLML